MKNFVPDNRKREYIFWYERELWMLEMFLVVTGEIVHLTTNPFKIVSYERHLF